MPGAGIPGFLRKAAAMAKAGIYDIRIHRDEVLLPILQHWQIFELTGLDAAAEDARRVLPSISTSSRHRRSGSRRRWPRPTARGSSGASDRVLPPRGDGSGDGGSDPRHPGAGVPQGRVSKPSVKVSYAAWTAARRSGDAPSSCASRNAATSSGDRAPIERALASASSSDPCAPGSPDASCRSARSGATR